MDSERGERQTADALRAASDMIGAYCAANPVPKWPTMPGGIAPFAARTEPIEVTYITAPSVALTDEAAGVLFKAAQAIAQAGGTHVEYAYGALLRALANWEQARVEASNG